MDRHFNWQVAVISHNELVEKSLIDVVSICECFGRSRQSYSESVDISGNPLIIQGREGRSDHSMEITRVTLDVDVGVMIVDFNNCVRLVRISDQIVEKLVSIQGVVGTSHVMWHLSSKRWLMDCSTSGEGC